MFSYKSRALAMAFGALGFVVTWARKHCPCRALATWALENTAPAVLWPLGRWKGLLEPPFVPRGRSNGLLEPLLGTPRMLERAAGAPARCPQGARRGCASPRTVPQCARRGCSSLLSVPGCSQWLFKLLVCTKGARRAEFQARP